MAKETSDSKKAQVNINGSGETPEADLNSTPSANRLHISFFGRRNAGKSSLVNAVTGQSLSIVSKVRGTTTDPVRKAMELLPLGPVVITDTPGIDDTGIIGEKRVERTYNILSKTDVAVLVIDAAAGPAPEDMALIDRFKEKQLPFVVAFNKADLAEKREEHPFPYLYVSALTGEGITRLKEKLGEIGKPAVTENQLIGDRLSEGDIVILVTPIDSSAPKGRLILPQVQTIRDILDAHAACMVTQTEQLPICLSALQKSPALVVTDSQDFHRVKDMVPADVKLTSFSILMARFKGFLDTAVSGARCLSRLSDGDRVLISEGCTHHRQCEDIGTVKLPGWIESCTGKKLSFSFTSGGEFPQSREELKDYALIVHCGGCMLNEREMVSRMEAARQAGVPFTNYGTLIAHINGILERSLEIFHG